METIPLVPVDSLDHHRRWSTTRPTCCSSTTARPPASVRSRCRGDAASSSRRSDLRPAARRARLLRLRHRRAGGPHAPGAVRHRHHARTAWSRTCAAWSSPPRDIETIVLSHGHFDHTGGLYGLVARARPARTSPCSSTPTSGPGAGSPSRAATARDAHHEPRCARGRRLRGHRGAAALVPPRGSLLVTGEVDRTTEFERASPSTRRYRPRRWQPDPLILDDQALIANVRGRGLVVLTGCGHSGIVNILRYAQQPHRREQVHAVVGGFHLNGPLFETIIGPTCDALAELRTRLPVPTHCTGWRAIHAIAARFPDAFIQNSVGTRLEFGA